MNFFPNAWQFIGNLDTNLLALVNQYGFLIYPLLFLIIFCETGLVVAPFLPGDSLIFAAGAIAATGAINIFIIFFVLLFAAIIGDSVNYYIGKYSGKKIIEKHYINVKYIDKAQSFYDKYGNKTIVLARFMPIVRTFAPFVAGIGKMNYSRFIFYNIFGAILWVSLFVFGGYFFGNIPIIKEHFSIAIIAIIIISIIPAIVEYIKYKFNKNN